MMEKQELMEKIENYVNELCGKIMDEQGVTSGDIDPWDAMRLQACYEEISEIVLRVVEENKQ